MTETIEGEEVEPHHAQIAFDGRDFVIEELAKAGVIFCPISEALQTHPELVWVRHWLACSLGVLILGELEVD
jgi:hypothetical protein